MFVIDCFLQTVCIEFSDDVVILGTCMILAVFYHWRLWVECIWLWNIATVFFVSWVLFFTLLPVCSYMWGRVCFLVWWADWYFDPFAHGCDYLPFQLGWFIVTFVSTIFGVGLGVGFLGWQEVIFGPWIRCLYYVYLKVIYVFFYGFFFGLPVLICDWVYFIHA